MNDSGVPDAFRDWNARRQAQGASLRDAIAAVMRECPGILARDVRAKLDATTLDRLTLPRKRAIQLHMQAIRSAGHTSR